MDAETGAVRARFTAANDTQISDPACKAKGFSEWDGRAIAERAISCLRAVSGQLGDECRKLAGIGITGQQHGVLLVDKGLAALRPFINWQDRRGEELFPARSIRSCAKRFSAWAKPDRGAVGCRLATGYLGLTLFWLSEHKLLPNAATACFLMDDFAALLTGGDLPPTRLVLPVAVSSMSPNGSGMRPHSRRSICRRHFFLPCA